MIFEIVVALCIFFIGIPIALSLFGFTVGLILDGIEAVARLPSILMHKWAEVLAFFIVVPGVIAGIVAVVVGGAYLVRAL